ncbi:MAG: hypothetical protein JNM74_14545, partial [Myxococcales bacterium]|nr:hypothetical protein [Myxococcales bacterium]
MDDGVLARGFGDDETGVLAERPVRVLRQRDTFEPEVPEQRVARAVIVQEHHAAARVHEVREGLDVHGPCRVDDQDTVLFFQLRVVETGRQDDMALVELTLREACELRKSLPAL